MKIEYSEEAAADLAEATGWYGSSRIGFDEVFLASVLRAETLVSEHPIAGPAWPDIPEQARIRRALVPGFPNALAFRIERAASRPRSRQPSDGARLLDPTAEVGP